jgi:ABC-type uncharacterized transport system auxiliary subunit
VDGDYTLAVEIRAFQVDVGNGSAAATVTLFAKIIQERRSRVLATKEFTARTPANKDDPANGVAALQSAFDQVAKDLVRWAASPAKGRSGA